MPRRAVGASRFDIIAQEEAGAAELWRMIHKDSARFQTAQSLYIQTSVEGFDDFADDQWAMALEAIRPGNIPHSLKVIKIEFIGKDWFEAYSTTVLSSCSTNYASRSHLSGGALTFLSERAFIKALFNIRGVEKIEISGPMQTELKKRLTVAMTTRPGRRVREWQNGGGLRTDDDIAWGTWAAAMQPSDEEETYAATAYELNSFPSQTFVPQQPMQIAVHANFEPNRVPSLTPIRPLDSITRSKLPLIDKTIKHDSLASVERSEKSNRGAKQPKAEVVPSSLDKMKMEDAYDFGTHTLLSASKNMAVMQRQRRSDDEYAEGKSNKGSAGHEQSGKGNTEMENWADDRDDAVPSDDMNDEDYDDAEY